MTKKNEAKGFLAPANNAAAATSDSTPSGEALQEMEAPMQPDLKSMRRDQLLGFAANLRSPHTVEACADDTFFAELLELAVEAYGVHRPSLAEAINTDNSTVGRWISEKRGPYVVARPAIVATIADMVEAVADGKA